MNVTFEAFKLKTQLENLTKATTLENANVLLSQIQQMKNENFQFVQDVFLTQLLMLTDDSKGLKKNEIKTSLIGCINLILRGSKLKQVLPYRAILSIILRQIYNPQTNSYQPNLPEELKIAVLECFEVASRQLDYDAVDAFMVEDNKILLGQCIFVCKEAITRETYAKIRKTAIEALMSLMQIHDKADFNDLVLRDQISKIVFLVLPQISAVLIKVCQEEPLRGSSIVQIATKAIGRFLCIVFEDYERKPSAEITNEDFMKLLTKSSDNDDDDDGILKPKNQTQSDFIENLKKSNEWICAAAKRIALPLERLKILRGSENERIRNELAVLSWNLLDKCLVNIRPLKAFLISNLLMFSDDSDDKVREFSQASLKKLSSHLPELNQEIAELFSSHLTAMPRIILTGDETEQIAGVTLLNSFIITISGDDPQLNSLLDNSVILEKFLNVMLSCCEIEVPNDLLFFENLATNALDNQFYQMSRPWRQLKNLKTNSTIKKFSEVCQNVGRSKSAQVCVNYLLDNMNSIEYLTLMIEILSCGRSPTITQDQIEGLVEEFLNETYWTMKIQATERVEKKQKSSNEEWFQDRTPGLYESAIEVRLRDVSLEDHDDKLVEVNLKAIKYNILCTCFVIELIGLTATLLEKNFQRFMLRSLHKVIEKAGNSNFIIRTAGIYSLEKISAAMGFKEISELIDANADYLLFNIQKLLKRHHNNDSIIEMLSVVFRYSKNSMTSYIKDIVETASDQITNKTFVRNTCGYLKLFHLYVSSIKQWEDKTDEATPAVNPESEWDEFTQQCLFELENSPENIDDSTIPSETTEESDNQTQDVPESPYESNDEPNEDDNKLPEHIELVIKIMTSTLQFLASSNSSEVIATHEIFIDGFSVIHHYENHFLPMVHQMWYPFTKQFQVKNLVILQYSFRLLILVARFAKNFVHQGSTKDVIPVVNKFLTQSMATKALKSNLSYTQEFKLQSEILSNYGGLAVDLDLDDKAMDGIVDILLAYEKSSNESLVSSSRISLELIKIQNPGLIHFKRMFE